MPGVAIVLPPREGFSAASAGAIGLLVRRLAQAPSEFSLRVIGPKQATTFPGIDYRAAPMPWLRLHPLRRYEAGLARVLRAAPADLVEIHNRPDMALFLARKFPAVPIVLVLHNDPQGMRGARTAAERTRLLARLARVVTVSDYIRRRLLEGVAAPLREPMVVPNSLDLREITAEPAQRDRTILFVGRVVADKGADRFVAACARALPLLPGWRAALIGADRFGADTPVTPFLRALRPRAAAAGITMAGWQPHAQVLAAMGRAAIVVVPSRWAEPFGLTALEAMAAGAALVCSPMGGLPEVVGDAAVIADPTDIAGLAAAIVALANDPQRRAALGAAGRQRAGLFDVAHEAAALDALRRDVLAAWPSGGTRPI